MAAVNRREYSGNAAATTLSSDISNSATSIPVTDGTGYPTGTDPFYIVIGRGTSSEEKILCSSRTGNTITASSRGADDTSATSHDSGETVEHVWTAQDADDVNKVAAALTTKGDLLGFSTEPTRVPVGADDTLPVADSSDAQGWVWKAATAIWTILTSDHDGHDHSTALSDSSVNDLVDVLAAAKSADESVTSSTTLQDDDHLSVSLAANTTYRITMFLHAVLGGGLKAAFNIPTGASIAWGADKDPVAGTDDTSAVTIDSSAVGATRFYAVTGAVITGGSAGTLQFRWAQDSSSGTSTTLKAGSLLRAVKIA